MMYISKATVGSLIAFEAEYANLKLSQYYTICSMQIANGTALDYNSTHINYRKRKIITVDVSG